MIAVLFLAVPGSNAVGAAISGAVLGLDGVLSMAGWQWIFLLESVPAILLAIAVLVLLPDGPRAARWLNTEERTWLEAQLAAERSVIQERRRALTVGQTLTDPRVLVLAVIYLTIVTASYGITFFLPQIIKSLGLSNVATGLVTGIPYLIGTLGMMLWGGRPIGSRSAGGTTSAPAVWRGWASSRRGGCTAQPRRSSRYRSRRSGYTARSPYSGRCRRCSSAARPPPPVSP